MDPGLLIIVVALPICAFLAIRRGPSVFMLAMCALVPFPIAIAGEAFSFNLSPVDVLAGMMVVYTVVRQGRNSGLVLAPVGIPLAFFLLINVVSSLMMSANMDSVMSLARMALATLAAVLIFGNLDIRLFTADRCLDIYLVGAICLSGFSLLAFMKGGIGASEYTLDIHKNSLGPIFGAGIIIAMASLLNTRFQSRYKLFWIFSLACCGLGIMLTLSRSGWIATAAAMALILYLSRGYKAFAISLIVLIPIVVAVWYLLPDKAVTYATDLSSDAYVVKARLGAINDVMAAYQKDPLFGVGVGLRKVIEPHNVFVLTLGETGLVGLAALIALLFSSFHTFRKALRVAGDDVSKRRIVVVGAAVFLLVLVSGMMDVYWRRGVVFMAWACVGMAVGILRQPPHLRRVIQERPRGESRLRPPRPLVMN